MPAPEPPSPTRIGIFGGTFDPPHAGHVAAARAVIAQLGLDRLLLVVANDPWQKSGQRVVSPAADRFTLVEAVVPEIPGAEASRLEIDRGGPSYSVDTAEEILAEAGGQPVELYLVVGADLVPELGSWHRAADLRRLVTLAVVSRPTGPAPAVPPGWRAERWMARRCPSPARRSVTSWRRAGRSRAWSPKPSSVASAAALCTLCLE